MIRVYLGLASMVLVAAPAVFAAPAVQSQPAPVMQSVAIQITSVKNATLGAIGQLPVDTKVEDFEGAILFAIDNIDVPYDVVDQGLAAAENILPDGNAKTAIQNIRRMKRRVAGTGAIPSGQSSLFSGPAIGGGGGGGTANYGN